MNNERFTYRSFRRGCVLGVVGMFLVGCGNNDFSDLEQTITEIKAMPKGHIDGLEPTKVAEPFLFDLDGSRNPFQAVEKEQPVVEEGGGNGIQPDPTRSKEDLESYALDTLRMVGTLVKDSTLWGLVLSTNNNTLYRVKVGNYMGLNDGKIIDISDTDIKLTEIVPDKNPKTWREQPAALKLITTE